MASTIDMSGQRFGRLRVMSREKSDGRGEARWRCICDCGSETVVLGSHLRSGRILSCGCYAREKSSQRMKEHYTGGNVRHMGRHTRLYQTWGNVKTRCLNAKNRAYKWYGAIGVTICAEWLKFEGFRDWALSNGYTDDLTIDRIDPFGNYEPSNCRWIPKNEQRANQRRAYI